MRTRIVRIGNSRGVRIPKPLLEEAGLEDEVKLTLGPDGILISPAARRRANWSEAAGIVRERGEDGLLDAPSSIHPPNHSSIHQSIRPDTRGDRSGG